MRKLLRHRFEIIVFLLLTVGGTGSYLYLSKQQPGTNYQPASSFAWLIPQPEGDKPADLPTRPGVPGAEVIRVLLELARQFLDAGSAGTR
jgi:hypothetical protein